MPALLALLLFPLERAIAGRAASGLASRASGPSGPVLQALLEPAFLLFMAVVVLLALEGFTRQTTPLRETLGLPRRPSAPREWALGAVLGWAVPLAGALLLVLTRSVQFSFWTAPAAFFLALATLLGLLATTLAVEITFRGLPFRWLGDAIGQAWASIVLALLFALLLLPGARYTPVSLLIAILLGLLLSIGWLRTHALWLSWSLNFAWTATLGVLFGLPVAGATDLSSVVQANLDRAPRLLGRAFGPDSAPVTVLLLLIAIAVLVRATRDYAWSYTHPVLKPAGFPMDVAPPPAHAAMEAAAPPLPLVQILSSTPQERSRDDLPPSRDTLQQ